MKTADYLILGVIFFWLLLVAIGWYRRKKGGNVRGCGCCNGEHCGSCAASRVPEEKRKQSGIL